MPKQNERNRLVWQGYPVRFGGGAERSETGCRRQQRSVNRLSSTRGWFSGNALAKRGVDNQTKAYFAGKAETVMPKKEALVIQQQD